MILEKAVEPPSSTKGFSGYPYFLVDIRIARCGAECRRQESTA
jgi:hypothetical protein